MKNKMEIRQIAQPLNQLLNKTTCTKGLVATCRMTNLIGSIIPYFLSNKKTDVVATWTIEIQQWRILTELLLALLLSPLLIPNSST